MRRAAAAALVAVVLAACGGPSGGARVGRVAPPIDQETVVEGERLVLASLRGRPVLVNFWGSWCAPCKNELPRLVERQDRVAIVGVSVKESRRLSRQALEGVGARWPSVHDPDERVARAWKVGAAYPVTYALDAGGVVRARHIGEASEADLDALIAAAATPSGR